ncbi:MAG: 2-succinyl-6-hydroxy-2,4-cyclohexadiene-1-carboxylate synthase, partial [Myxococcota bacterium]|nr:2-succinyl-6-hydroxy-2,4-cyclohexadiene-1-carboxylate synthase [Myxococcota bacterium]
MTRETVYVRFGACKFRVQRWHKPQATHQTTLVMLHGFTGDGLDFEPLVEALDVATLIAPDLLGHGGSSAPEEPLELYSIPEQLKQLEHLLDALDAPHPILLGYSMGGRVALQLAVHLEDHFEGLILIGATPGLRASYERDARREQDAKLAAQLAEQGPLAFLEMWQQKPIIATQERIANPWHAQMQQRRAQSSGIGWRNSLLAAGTGSMASVWHDLEHVHTPALLITGQEDAKFHQLAEQMRVLFPQVIHTSIPDAGHCAPLETPPPPPPAH